MSTYNWNELVESAGEISGPTSYDPLPVGVYDLKITKAEPATASTGKSMFKIVCEVVNGPHAERRLWHNFVISPDNSNALQMFFRQMGALGLNADFFKTNPSQDSVAQAMIGRTFRGKVGTRTWQGEERNEIKGVMPPAAAPSVPGVPGIPAAPAVPPAPAVPAPPAAVVPPNSPF